MQRQCLNKIDKWNPNSRRQTLIPSYHILWRKLTSIRNSQNLNEAIHFLNRIIIISSLRLWLPTSDKITGKKRVQYSLAPRFLDPEPIGHPSYSFQWIQRVRIIPIDSFLIFLVQADINQILISQITITPQVSMDSFSTLTPKLLIQYLFPIPVRILLLYDFETSIIMLYLPIALHFMNCQPTLASEEGCSPLVIQVRTIPPLVDSFTLLIAVTISLTIPPPR